MNKRIISSFTAIIILAAIFTGCGSTKGAKDTTVAENEYGSAQNQDVLNYTDEGTRSSQQTADMTAKTGAAPESAQENALSGNAISGGVDVASNVSNAILAERKIIRSANVTAEVDNFDEAYGKINSFILGLGYIQSTNINTEKVYSGNKMLLIKKGTITMRVDKEQFDKILGSIKGIGDILNWSINGEDVTDKYFDTESRLRLLQYEQTRLEEYLKKLNDLDQIFRTESRLTDIRHEIEGLTGNLKKITSLVELSTISLNLSEKYPDSVNPLKPKAYGQRLLDNLMDSMKGVISFCGEVVILVISALPVLVFLGLIVVLGLYLYRRISRKKTGKALKDKKDDADTDLK